MISLGHGKQGREVGIERWGGVGDPHASGGRTMPRGQYQGFRQPSSDDSFHSPTVIPPWVLDKPSIIKSYHYRQTTRRGVTARLPMMATLHDTRFVECPWWNDSWTVKNCCHLMVVGLHDTGPRSSIVEAEVEVEG